MASGPKRSSGPRFLSYLTRASPSSFFVRHLYIRHFRERFRVHAPAALRFFFASLFDSRFTTRLTARRYCSRFARTYALFFFFCFGQFRSALASAFWAENCPERRFRKLASFPQPADRITIFRRSSGIRPNPNATRNRTSAFTRFAFFPKRREIIWKSPRFLANPTGVSFVCVSFIATIRKCRGYIYTDLRVYSRFDDFTFAFILLQIYEMEVYIFCHYLSRYTAITILL